MKKHLWKLWIGIGIVPFLLPIVLGIYRMSIELWTLGDWLILYSYIYWPTYVLGLFFIVAGIVLRRKRKENMV